MLLGIMGTKWTSVSLCAEDDQQAMEASGLSCCMCVLYMCTALTLVKEQIVVAMCGEPLAPVSQA